MSSRGRLADVEVHERFRGVRVQTFESERATVNRYEFAPGARFPRHRHSQEQITLIEEGEVTFALEDEEYVLGAGEWQIVEPDVSHRVTAGDRGARVTAVLVPRRGTAAVAMEE